MTAPPNAPTASEREGEERAPMRCSWCSALLPFCECPAGVARVVDAERQALVQERNELRAQLLAARRGEEAKDALLRDFARASANLVNAAMPASKHSHTIPSGFLAALGSLTNDAAAALAAAQESV